MLRVECIADIDKFLEIQGEWDSFVRGNFPGAYFFDHDWMVHWMRAYLGKTRIFVLLVRDGEHLVGAAPLYVSRENFSGFPVARLSLIGAGYGVEDFPLACSHEEAVELLITTLHTAVPWQLAVFSRLTPAFARCIVDSAQKSRHKVEKQDTINPVIRIEGTYEQYFSGRSKNFRANFRKKMKRIQEFGDLHFTSGDDLNISEVIERVAAIGRESWQGEKRVNLVSSAHGADFLRDMIANFHQRGILDIHFIEIDKTPIAYLFGAVLDSTYYAIETAYLQEYFDVSPGMLLHLHILEKVFDRKQVKLFDFGYDAEYKRKWTEDNRPEQRIIVYNNSLYAKLVQFVRESPLVERIRKWKN